MPTQTDLQELDGIFREIRVRLQQCKWASDWRKRNPEKVKLAQKKYQARHRDRVRENRQKRDRRFFFSRSAHRSKYRCLSLYGLSEEQLEAKLNKQEGRCAICGNRDRLVIDHSHSSGTVRGLLCNPCNKGLGCFVDRPDILRVAASYLETYQ